MENEELDSIKRACPHISEAKLRRPPLLLSLLATLLNQHAAKSCQPKVALSPSFGLAIDFRLGSVPLLTACAYINICVYIEREEVGRHTTSNDDWKIPLGRNSAVHPPDNGLLAGPGNTIAANRSS